jgi:3-hydroxyisobutyrate dehydrogenase
VRSAHHGGVGFIGLGQIGKPMAKRWIDWPAGLVVCDVNPDAVASFAKRGAKIAATPAELAAQVGLVSIMVRDDAQVSEVVASALTTAAPGTVIAIHSTIHAATAERIAGEAAEHDVLVVDAPVSGGGMGAAAGRLAVMVGGTEEAFAACEKPFAAFADLVIHAGPIGAGTKMKLARNLLHFVAFTAVTEAQRVAEAAGLDIARLGEVVRHSDAVTGGPGAIMHRTTTAPLSAEDPWRAVMEHVVALGEKDLTLALELAAELRVDVPLAELARQRLAAGLGL